LTKCIAKEYAEDNIRSYTLTSGIITTAATHGVIDEDEREKASRESAMRRCGTPEKAVRIAVCIASDNFSYTTGNTLIRDRGSVLI
jgi:3-oxoacyl-[acyl-carrier protein] reductase